MPNLDFPRGFPIVSSLVGGPPYTRAYTKVVGDTKALGFGDLVILEADGVSVARKAAGGPFAGVCLNFGAASTATTHLVSILTPASICMAQTDGSLVTADTALNADVVADVAPNTITGISAQEIDSATEAATNTLDVRLLRLAPYVGNASGTNSAWLCIINDCQISNLTAGI